MARYVVKQAGPAVETGSSVAAEKAVYSWLAHERGLADLAPRTVELSACEDWLLLEAIAQAEPLQHLIGGPEGDCLPLLTALAKSVGRLHAVGAKRAGDESLPLRRPWLFGLPSGVVPDFAATNRDVASFVGELRAQQSLMTLIEGVAARWTACTTIHGDLKWDNVLARIEPDGTWRVWLIDWELSGVGDPIWDISAIIEGVVTLCAPNIASAGELARSIVAAYRDVAGPELTPEPDQLVCTVAALIVQAAVQLAAMASDGGNFGPARTFLETAEALAADPTGWGNVLIGDTG
jgi:hypothetical protein